TLALEDASFEIANLATDGAAPARVRASIAAPGLVESLEANGTLAATPERASLRLDVVLGGVTGRALAPYLAPLGAATELEDGRVTAVLDAGAALAPDGALEAHA